MPPVSVCMIAKDEEENLPRCLESLKPYGFEVILVDTGSADKTKEIAASYNAKVFDFEWVDDFSAARNFAASKATNNWILAIDCDEYITAIKLPQILSLIRQYPRYVGVLDIENEMQGNDETGKRTYTTKLVRLYSRKYNHFAGAIHEQVVPLNYKEGKEIFSFDIPLKLYHTGYVGSASKISAKNKRNIDLLMAALEKDPQDAYNYFQLGQSYVMGDEYEKACEWFGKGLAFDLEPSLEYVQTMVVAYGQSLLKLKRNEEALNFEGIYPEFSAVPDFVYLMGRIYAENNQPLKALAEFLKVINMPEGKQQGVTTFLPYYQIAVIYDNMALSQAAGDKKEYQDIALMYYRKCGDFVPAQRRLAEIADCADCGS
ncbi:MAG: glycosyltransferase [Lachnospiraceae bacterium]|nr:glycosyltransferase [Lachnospiraceae bacterium]